MAKFSPLEDGNLVPMSLVPTFDGYIKSLNTPCVCDGKLKTCDATCSHAPYFRKECGPLCGLACVDRHVPENFSPIKILVSSNGHSKEGVLYAKENVTAGTLLLEYVGMVQTEEEFKKECEEKPKERKYFMEFVEGTILNGREYGNEARFARHSCNPNCEAVLRYKLVGEQPTPCVMLVANRAIRRGDRLTYAYNVNCVEGLPKMICTCGKPSCPDNAERH